MLMLNTRFDQYLPNEITTATGFDIAELLVSLIAENVNNAAILIFSYLHEVMSTYDVVYEKFNMML